MSRVNVTLSYSRDGGELLTGSIVTALDREEVEDPFENMAFNDVYTQLALTLKDLSDAELGEVAVVRLDTLTKHKSTLSGELVGLLRNDLEVALQMLNPPPTRVVISDRVRPPDIALIPKLRAGIDTLAAAFSENVYAAVDNGRVESPITGRWEELNRPYQEVTSTDPGVPARRVYGPASVGGVYVRGCGVDGQDYSKWAVFRVKDLLATDAQEFYLPRQWNAAAWISRENLNSRYKRYCEETSDRTEQ